MNVELAGCAAGIHFAVGVQRTRRGGMEFRSARSRWLGAVISIFVAVLLSCEQSRKEFQPRSATPPTEPGSGPGNTDNGDGAKSFVVASMRGGTLEDLGRDRYFPSGWAVRPHPSCDFYRYIVPFSGIYWRTAEAFSNYLLITPDGHISTVHDDGPFSYRHGYVIGSTGSFPISMYPKSEPYSATKMISLWSDGRLIVGSDDKEKWVKQQRERLTTTGLKELYDFNAKAVDLSMHLCEEGIDLLSIEFCEKRDNRPSIRQLLATVEFLLANRSFFVTKMREQKLHMLIITASSRVMLEFYVEKKILLVGTYGQPYWDRQNLAAMWAWASSRKAEDRHESERVRAPRCDMHY